MNNKKIYVLYTIILIINILYCFWLFIISYPFNNEVIRNFVYYITKYVSSSLLLSVLLLGSSIFYIKNFEHKQSILVFLKLNHHKIKVFLVVGFYVCLALWIINCYLKVYNLNLLVILAPLAEEIFFTGILFQVLQRRYSIYIAAFINAICFGLIHMPACIMQHYTIMLMSARLAFLILFSIIMCFTFHKTKSLFVPLLMHWLNNFILLI